jgi:FkbH-like protein
MKEIVLSEAPEIFTTLPPPAVEFFRATRAVVKRKSSIVWGEHCSECAFPSCYTTCEFYTPRSDLHCRRFAQGIESVRLGNAPDVRGLSRIRFRKWGKLEGSGPTALSPYNKAIRQEQMAGFFDKAMARLRLPRRVGNSLAFRLNKSRRDRAVRSDGTYEKDTTFVVEGWLEHDESIAMTLTLVPWSKSVDGLYQTPFTLKQGYNRVVVPISAIAASLPLHEPFAIQIEIIGEPPSQPIVFGIIDFVELTQGLQSVQGAGIVQGKETMVIGSVAPQPTTGRGKAKTAKCVVWDLDDTLWSGTLVEDGIEGLRLNPAAAEAVRLLDSRGILNSVASKNDEALAMAALKHFGLAEYMLFPQIHWEPKSDSIRRIAESIDIGIDTFVFVDDQPFERAEVGKAHPSVTLMTPDDIAKFADHALFDVPATAESKKRRLLYRDEEKRQKAATSNGSNYESFLRSCDIRLHVSEVTPESAERVYELTQRTNQLNVTGERFSREQIAQFVNRTHPCNGYVLRCTDSFGDYGIIGFCVVNRKSAQIDSFFMSCRVQRKRVEHAFFAWLSKNLGTDGALQLTARYKKTEKNGASVQLFSNLGFTFSETGPGEGTLRRNLDAAWPESDIVAVRVELSNALESAAS